MKFISGFLLLSFSLLLISCNKEDLIIPEGEYTLEEGFTISFNDNDDFKIHFDRVLQDSRNSSLDNSGVFRFKLITSKNEIDQPSHELRAVDGYVTTLFYTPVGVYRFKLADITPSQGAILNGTDERYAIYFTLEEV